MAKVIVIGGGISGLCSAYYLTKEGHQVTVIDKNNISTGASFINAGYIVPSHFLTMAAPGMISKGLKWMLDGSSPFYVKPRLDWEFFKWALDFKRSATATNVEKAVPVIKNINLKSRELYEQLLGSLDFPFHYERKGLLMVYASRDGETEESEVASRAIREGLEAEKLSQEELKKLQPGFSDAVLGGIHYRCDSHTTPAQFMTNLKKWLQSRGVVFELNQEITGVSTESGRVIAVTTGTGRFEADEFVMATGSWTSQLARSLGLKIPIQGGKGYSIDDFRPNNITLPAILVEAKVAVTPMEGFTRFAGTMEFSGNNGVIRKKRIEAIARSVKRFYSDIELGKKEKEAAVSGLRPVSPDGLPFIGKTEKFNNLTVAAGHAMMGWSLGPITGKLVAELVSKQVTTVPLEPFKVERFG